MAWRTTVRSHRKSRVVSHLDPRPVLAASTPWYEAFGYTRVGVAADGMLFLEPGASSTWRPLLLVEDAAMPQRGACYEAGLSRLSLYVNDMDKACAARRQGS